MSNRRVVVTGLGIVSPIGNAVAAAWDNILAGRSGIGPITRIDCSKFSTKIGGCIHDFDVAEYIPPKDARKMDAFMHYGVAACCQAIGESGFEVTEESAPRIGVAFGSGIGGLETIEANFEKYLLADKSPNELHGSLGPRVARTLTP